jgi:DNA ligase (NAD+)
MNEKKKRIDELNEKLTNASRMYYSSMESGITDTNFDLLMKELRRLQDETGYIPENSIAMRIGSDLQTGFDKITHPELMLTIDNSYDDEELSKWVESMIKKYNPTHAEISTKFDGVSLEIHYHNGELVSASTRGDKTVGDDVTENAKTIEDIPLKLKDWQWDDVYVRGEVLMPRSTLKRINENSKKKFANCRNAASGTIKQLDSKEVARRGLIFRPWDVLFFNSNGKRIANDFPIDKANFLFNRNDFVTEDFARMQIVDFTTELPMIVSKFKKRLDESGPDFDYDGVVIKVAADELRNKIGSSDHQAIKWGIARKWNEDRIGYTILENVTWQVGSTGILTPVANFRPIYLDGVIVSNATLHNLDFIRKNDLMIGAPVKITRSGGVIPYVLGRPSDGEYYEHCDENLGERTSIVLPTTCPECGSPIIYMGDSIKCSNSECPGVIRGLIENWCSKSIMNIDGVGPEIIRDLMNAGLISWQMDLYRMTTELTSQELVERLGPGYALKSAQNIIDSIMASVSKPIENVVAGMGIAGIGLQNAKTLIETAGSLENLSTMSESQLMDIDGIGEVLAGNIREFMDTNGNDWISALHEFGFNTEASKKAEPSGSELSGLKIVFTGSSQWFKGDLCEKFLESRGAKCGHSVSKKTDWLVTGENPGASKVTKAESLGVKIISEEDFFAKYGLPTSI